MVQLQLDNGESVYRIQSYQRGESVIVNDRVFTRSLIVTPQKLDYWQPQSLVELTVAHFEILPALKADCILLGCGPSFRLVDNVLLQPLFQAGIGVEMMDTGAACRTYMVLMAEGRSVAAALLIR